MSGSGLLRHAHNRSELQSELEQVLSSERATPAAAKLPSASSQILALLDSRARSSLVESRTEPGSSDEAPEPSWLGVSSEVELV